MTIIVVVLLILLILVMWNHRDTFVWGAASPRRFELTKCYNDCMRTAPKAGLGLFGEGNLLCTECCEK